MGAEHRDAAGRRAGALRDHVARAPCLGHGVDVDPRLPAQSQRAAAGRDRGDAEAGPDQRSRRRPRAAAVGHDQRAGARRLREPRLLAERAPSALDQRDPPAHGAEVASAAAAARARERRPDVPGRRVAQRHDPDATRRLRRGGAASARGTPGTARTGGARDSRRLAGGGRRSPPTRRSRACRRRASGRCERRCARARARGPSPPCRSPPAAAAAARRGRRTRRAQRRRAPRRAAAASSRTRPAQGRPCSRH